MNDQDKKTILLVEDEAVTSKLTSKTLMKFGYNVETVDTGEKAIETAISNKKINLILMDIDLGEGIDGTEAALIILSVRDIPVVFLSSHTEPEVVEKTEKITSYGYVVKNSSSTVLDASIKMAFKLFQAGVKEKEKEEEYRLLFENASVGIFIAQDNQIKIFNSSFEKSFGYPPDMIISEPFTSFIHPDDKVLVIGRYLKRLKGEKVETNYPFRIIHGSGEIRWVEITSALITWKDKPASLNYIIDITERKLAETESRLTKEALLEREDRFQSYFNMPLIGIAITSHEKGWIEVNSQICRMLEYTEDELKKLTWAELTHPDDLSSDLEQFELVLSGKIDYYSLDKRFIRKNGSPIWTTMGVGCVRNPDRSVNYFVATLSDITKQKLIENSLRESDIRLNAIAGSANDAIIMIDQFGNISYWNPAAEFILGYTAAEVMGRNLHSIIVPERYLEAHRAAFAVFTGTGKGAALGKTLDMEAIRKDGKEINIQLSLSAIEISGSWHSTGIIRDTTERKKIEDALRKSETILKQVLSESTTLIDPLPGDVGFEKIADTFIEITGAKYAAFNLFDEDGLEFTTVGLSGINEKLQKITSILGFNILNKKWKHDPAREEKTKDNTITHFDSLHDLTGIVINRKISELVEKTFNLGKVFVIKITKSNKAIGDITLIFQKDEMIQNAELAVLFANQIGMFITRKFIEDRLIIAIQESDILRQKEKEANTAKSVFLSNMSHEIRTPMNAIIGMTDLALMTSDEKELHEYLSTIKDSGTHLLQVINDILDFSKIESGNMMLEYREFHLRNIFHSVENMIQFEIKKKGLELTLDISNDLPVRIIADELRIRQILINLISNSLKFTEKGSIIIKASLKKNFKIEEGFSAIEISVSDTGCGIPKDKQDLIFSKFKQSDISTSRKYGGTGLGLSIVKELVNLMGGDVILKSEPGKGSEFIFWFKVKKVISAEKAIKDSYIQDKNNMKNKNLNILLAEDNDTNILLASTVLKKLGHSVTVARNGLEALDLIRKNNFELVFMDIEMPEMDGIEASKRIRSGECGNEKSNICIIAMSAHAVADIKKDGIEAGMNDFITKPIDITQIQERIDKTLGKNK